MAAALVLLTFAGLLIAALLLLALLVLLVSLILIVRLWRLHWFTQPEGKPRLK